MLNSSINQSDSDDLMVWRQGYLDGRSASEWCEWAAKLRWLLAEKTPPPYDDNY